MGAERAQSGRRAGAERVQRVHALGCGEGAERAQRGWGEAGGGMPERDAVDAVATSCNPMRWRLQPDALEAATLRGVPERDAVDAVALARGHRTVGESVA